MLILISVMTATIVLLVQIYFFRYQLIDCEIKRNLKSNVCIGKSTPNIKVHALINNSNGTEWIPIRLEARVLQIELYDKKYCYQLIITIKIYFSVF